MSEKDLVHHYKVLKQFLAISDDQQSRAKSNSSRAQRAREKLLKLSSAQFKELSTDVYDELKRRIDESRTEPDYLLPKTSFHPKRNQARQKLASLPQTRFKDLVADISYEIERRELHIERNLQHSYNPSVSSNGSYSQLQQQQQQQQQKAHDRKPSLASSHITNNDFASGYHSRLASHHLNDAVMPKQIKEEKSESPDTDETHTTSSKNITLPNAEASNQSIGIQSTQIVPTKANLTWSSDEEEEEDDDDDDNKNKDKHNDDNVGGEKEKNGAREVTKETVTKAPDAIPSTQNKELEKENVNEELEKLEALVNELKAKLSTADLEKLKLQSKFDSLQGDYDFSVNQNKSLSNELEILGKEKKDWLFKKEHLTKSADESEELSKELDRMKSINAALRLENQSLKNTSPVSKSIHNSPPAINPTPVAATAAAATVAAAGVGASVGAANSNTNSNMNTTTTPSTSQLSQKAMDEFLEKLERHQPTAPIAANNTGSNELRKQVKHWQRRYEDSRSNAIAKDIKRASTSKLELKSFTSPYGLISIKLVSDAQALFESFLAYIVNENFDADILFEKISKIAVVVNEIANQGDDQQPGSNEKSAVLRETVAHSLTATRYHAIYKQLFPRFIVEKSIVEVNCALCDLVGLCKLNENSTNLRVLDIDAKASKKLANESIAQQRPSEAKRKSLNEDFGVRPLRMANKLKINQSQQDSQQTKSSPRQPHLQQNDQISQPSAQQSYKLQSEQSHQIPSEKFPQQPYESFHDQSQDQVYEQPSQQSHQQQSYLPQQHHEPEILLHSSPPRLLKKDADESSPFVDTSKDKSIKSKTTSAFAALREQREKEREAKLSKVNASVNPTLMGATSAAIIGGTVAAVEDSGSHIPRVHGKSKSPNTSTQIPASDFTRSVDVTSVPLKKKEAHNVAFNDQTESIPAARRDIYNSDSSDSDDNEEEYDDLNDAPSRFNVAQKNTSFGSSTSGETGKNTISPAKEFGINVKRNVVEESPTRVAAIQSLEDSSLSRNAAHLPKENNYQGNRSFEDNTPVMTSTSVGNVYGNNGPNQHPSYASSEVLQTSNLVPEESLENGKDQQVPLPTRSLASTHNTSFDTALDNSFTKTSAYGNTVDNGPENSSTRDVSSSQKSSDTTDPDVTYREKGNIALLASKYEQGDQIEDAAPAKKSPPIQSKFNTASQGVHELANRINSQESSPNVHNPTSPPLKTSPSKNSILEKVKQFESPTKANVSDSISPQKYGRERVPFKSVRTSLELNKSSKSIDEPKQLSEPFSAVYLNAGLENKKDLGSKIATGAAVGVSAAAAAAGIASVATNDADSTTPSSSTTTTTTTTASTSSNKGKGLFQAFRDRFTGESNNQEEDKVKQMDTTQSDETNSDNEKHGDGNTENVISTVETSPPKDVDDEIVGKLVPVQYSNRKDSTLDDDDEDEEDNDSYTSNTITQKPAPISQPLINGSSQGSVYQSAESSNGTEEDLHKQSQQQRKAPVPKEDEQSDYDDNEETEEEVKARQRQEYRKSMAAATFNVDLFDIGDPDNTLTQVLLYLEHQTVQVINTIQSLLAAIKKPNATRGELRERTKAITVVISQMTEATNTSMNQTRNAQLKEHGSWVVRSLEDCYHRMNNLCKPGEKPDSSFADKNFKQRLAGISFDIAKCTKELVKTVEEASLKEDIAYLDARLSQKFD